MDSTKKSNLFRDLWARRVPHILGTYAFSSSGIILFLDWLVSRYNLNNLYTDVLLIAIVTLIPSIIMVAYFHGRPGKDEWMKSELIGIPVNLIITFICIFFFVSPEMLSGDEDRDNKIFQSIAVLYLDNLSSDTKNENLCSAITNGINTSLSRLGIFNVKARTDVLKFRKKVTSHSEINKILGVDAYIEGSLIKSGEDFFADIQLIDARNGNNIWADRFKRTADEILHIPQIIAAEVSKVLTGSKQVELTVSLSKNKENNQRSFSLLGEGINLLDSGDYDKSIKIFDSLLVAEPENKHAIYARGQAFEKSGNYTSALQSFELISSDSTSLSRLKNVWKYPDVEEIDNIDFYKKVLASEQLNIRIILSRNINTNSTEIFALDLNTNKELWAKTYRFTGIKPKISGNNLVLTSSTFGNMEATVYVHSLKTGRLIFSKEFSKRHENERVLVSVMKGESLDDSKYNDRVFLNIRRDETYNIAFVDLIEGKIIWEKTFPLETISEGDPLLYLMNYDDQLYALHQKGVKYYFFRVNSGSLLWEDVLADNNERIFVNQNNGFFLDFQIIFSSKIIVFYVFMIFS